MRNEKTMLRIMAISDLHGDEYVLERLKKFNFSNIDYLFIAGDICNNISYTKELLDIIDKRKTFYVPGNNEDERIREIVRRSSIWIHEKRKEIKQGFNVVGFGFSNITPFRTPGEIEEEDMLKKMEKLEIDDKTILLTHCPPKGILDNEMGCEAIKKIIERKKPAINLFGHIHEIEGKEVFKKTLCINIPFAQKLRAAFLTIDKNEKKVFFKPF